MPTKIISVIILSLVLSGCVSYPYTVVDDGRGVYYENPADYYGYASYSDLRYYPYWSLDYYYLNAWYDPWMGYYSPYFYPYYFSVWYSPWYWGPDYRWGRYAAWADPYWRHHYRRHHPDRPVTLPEEPEDPRYTAIPPVAGPGYRAQIRDNREPGMRRTSVAAPGPGGSGAMTVVSPSEGKVGRSRTGPVRDTGIRATVSPSSGRAASTPARPVAAPPVTSVQRTPGRSSGSSGMRRGRADRSRSPAPSRERDRE